MFGALPEYVVFGETFDGSFLAAVVITLIVNVSIFFSNSEPARSKVMFNVEASPGIRIGGCEGLSTLEDPPPHVSADG